MPGGNGPVSILAADEAGSELALSPLQLDAFILLLGHDVDGGGGEVGACHQVRLGIALGHLRL
mgnify:CR=1 FL=1